MQMELNVFLFDFWFWKLTTKKEQQQSMTTFVCLPAAVAVSNTNKRPNLLSLQSTVDGLHSKIELDVD